MSPPLLRLTILFSPRRPPSYARAQYLFSKGRPITVILGGDRPRLARGRTIVFLSTLRKVVSQFLELRRFSVGASCLSQTRGVPIGGPFWFVVIEAVLMHKEYNYDQQWPGRSRINAAGRYVDDLILLSHLRCRHCLIKVVRDVYGNTISFDPDSSQRLIGLHVLQPYLDLTFICSQAGLYMSHLHKNIQYAFSGNEPHRKKHSIEPFLAFLAVPPNSAIVLNSIRPLLAAAPGLHTMGSIPLQGCAAPDDFAAR